MSALPELEPHCGSWIVTSPSGRVTELYERSNAEKPLAENSGGSWEVLPAGTFSASGTNVNTALLVINA